MPSLCQAEILAAEVKLQQCRQTQARCETYLEACCIWQCLCLNNPAADSQRQAQRRVDAVQVRGARRGNVSRAGGPCAEDTAGDRQRRLHITAGAAEDTGPPGRVQGSDIAAGVCRASQQGRRRYGATAASACATASGCRRPGSHSLLLTALPFLHALRTFGWLSRRLWWPLGCCGCADSRC